MPLVPLLSEQTKHFVVLISLLWLVTVNRNQVEALLSKAFTRKDGQNRTQEEISFILERNQNSLEYPEPMSKIF
jgi:hypothetical protein